MNLPTVLHVQGVIKLPGIEPIVCALVECHGAPHQKIAEKQTGDRSIERCCADGIDTGPIIQPLLENRSTEPELMGAPDPANVVQNRGHWSIVLRSRRCRSTAEIER